VVERLGDASFFTFFKGLNALVDYRGEADLVEPLVGLFVLVVRQLVEHKAVYVRYSLVEEPLQNRQIADLVSGHGSVGDAEYKRLIPLVAPAVEKVRRLGVRPRDDDPRNFHYVELEPRGDESFDLLV